MTNQVSLDREIDQSNLILALHEYNIQWTMIVSKVVIVSG